MCGGVGEGFDGLDKPYHIFAPFGKIMAVGEGFVLFLVHRNVLKRAAISTLQCTSNCIRGQQKTRPLNLACCPIPHRTNTAYHTV